jgi:hypothetical protein
LTICNQCRALNSLEDVICTNCGALQYTGPCYIAVVGSENENGECRDSIERIVRRDGDELHYVRATKGFEARQLHLNNWYEKTTLPFILFLDHDMKFPAHTLERLRYWQLPYVSGLYMRRTHSPMAPIWFDYGQPGVMPIAPYTGIFSLNTLYKIGASGWGCILLHRNVIRDMKPILKGEDEIIEDDMDVLPYDLKRVMDAIHALDKGVGTMTGSEARRWIDVLKEEIRPLRGLKDNVGSDIRFPFYARLAGYDLYGDSGVMCDHMLNYPLSPLDYVGQSAANVRDISLVMRGQVMGEASRIQKATAEL